MTSPKKTQSPKRERYYAISAVAKMMNTHPQTLRMYERLGLIHPRRNRFNMRLYADEDIKRVKKIQHLTQDMGVNLAGVELVFKLMERIEELEKELEKKRQEVSREVEERAKILAWQMLDLRWQEERARRQVQIQPLGKSPLVRFKDWEILERLMWWLQKSSSDVEAAEEVES